MDVILNFFHTLCHFIKLVQPFLLASLTHLQPVVFIIQLQITCWQVSALYPNIVIQIHLHALFSTLFLHTQYAMSVSRKTVDCLEQPGISDTVMQDWKKIQIAIEHQD